MQDLGHKSTVSLQLPFLKNTIELYKIIKCTEILKLCGQKEKPTLCSEVLSDLKVWLGCKWSDFSCFPGSPR